LAACALPNAAPSSDGDSPPTSEETGGFVPTTIPATATEDVETTAADKWSLWANGTQLRGANIWQRIVVPELDGPEFLGDGYYQASLGPFGEAGTLSIFVQAQDNAGTTATSAPIEVQVVACPG
jgi:hypothetical protein